MKNEPDSSINIPTSKTAAAAATTLYLASQSARRAITDVRTVLLTPAVFGGPLFGCQALFGPHRL